MARSLRASEAGIKKAEEAFKLRGGTQDHLAGRADCTRQVVINFFAKRPVEKRLFQNICIELDLEWPEIAELEPGEEETGKTVDINDLVQTARENIRDSILQKCNTMRVLDMDQPIDLDDIYISVNILKKITAHKRLEIAELLRRLENLEQFFSLSTTVDEERVPGLDAVNKHSKLMILGKPGAGKTTFLKYLALQCIYGRFQPKRIPLFITLREFAEASNDLSLLEYLIQTFANYGIARNTKIKSGILESLLNWHKADTKNVVDLTSVEKLLNQGKLLILLDGLDEVKEADSTSVLKKIQDFTTQFHQNQFVITCRIAAREYIFEQFTEVEIADFNFEQIVSFTNKWFRVKKDPVKVEQIRKKLQEDKPIQELATNPLLLTLLCLVFEESGSFPRNRSELYKEGLDVLLKKWDVKRNIERDQVYKKLSLKRKEDLLSQIAKETFDRGEYFFKQKGIELNITKYISNLSEANTDLKELQSNSEVVLKSIEAQHGLLVERAKGIYSFSHLTFHEYFTARKLVNSSNAYAEQDETLQALAAHITEKRWREVFLLTVEMLESADCLLQLMKHQIDMLVPTDETLQKLLTWVVVKSSSVKASYKPVDIRLFYLAFAFNGSLNNKGPFVLDLAKALAFDPSVDWKRASELSLALAQSLDLVGYRSLRELQLRLEELKKQLPDIPTTENWENIKQWWQTNGKTWIKQLEEMIDTKLQSKLARVIGSEAKDFRKELLQHATYEDPNIGDNWQLDDDQIKLLQQYYNANQLLVDCLNSECYVTVSVRQEIENTLLLLVKK